MTTLILCAIGLFILALIIFPEFRSLFSGFTKKFVQDVAKTPEGAEATYIKAIDEATDRYTKAKTYANEISGKLERAKKNLEDAIKQKNSAEAMIEACFKKNRPEDAEVFAADHQIAMDNLEAAKLDIARLEPLKKQAFDLQSELETQLKKLEAEKKIVVNKLRLNKDSAELYEGLDDLAAPTATLKNLKAVREGAESLEDRATGARIVYENKTSTKAAKIKKEMGSAATNSFMAEMQAKYNVKK